jgi:hypothetical protein
MKRTRLLLVGFSALAAIVVLALALQHPGERPTSAAVGVNRERASSPAAPEQLEPARTESTTASSLAPSPSERTGLPDGLGDLAVQVVDRESGASLSGVPLRLRRAAPEWSQEVSSASDGRCRFVELEPGDYTLEPNASGERDYAADPMPVVIAGDTTEEVVLRVEPRWFLAGVVVAKGGTSPVAGVGLMARDARGKSSSLATSSDDGRFRSSGSYPAGELSVFLSQSETEGLLRTRGMGPELLQVIVGQEDVSRLTVEIEWSGVLRGIVVGPRGDPIPRAQLRVLSGDSIYLENASLRFWSLYENMRGQGRTSRSDSQGKFSFSGLPNDRTLVVVASALGFASGRSADLSPPFLASDDPIVQHLEEGGAIGGTVRDAQGRPLGEAKVTALSADTNYQPDPTRTDEQGAFRLEGLKPGSTEVTALAWSEGGRWYTIASGTIEVLAGREARLDLHAGADGVPISGVVVDQEGRLITADRLSLRLRTRPLEPRVGERAWGFDTPLDEDGTFDVTVSREGGYGLMLLGNAAGDRWESVEVQAPARDVRLAFTVGPTSELSINTFDAETGESIDRGHFTIAWDQGTRGGNFGGGGSLTLIREGLYTLTVDAKGYAPAARELDVRGTLQPQTLVEMRLDRGRLVEGVVLDAEGLPVKGCTVVLRLGRQLQLENLVYSGVDGRFTLPAAPMTGGSVCVIDESYRTLATAELGPGELVLTIGGE